ncbi:phosphatase PAP2 family protein [Sphaerobacter sp.]|uniref:phosphatase PAP2 family protein n=1 Tax=Sphaerobacter sp. TaxID=2099654 RepID=UPI001DE10259|nr:phosphatase PAP2 family protein [Sphaerobacter sp.]MBX5444148.1 phosphatase PAP2 family protein [Sphaerobacter sp.]
MADLIEHAAEVTDEAARRAHRAVVPGRVQRRRSRFFLLASAMALVGYLSLMVVVRANKSLQADVAATMRIQRAQHPMLVRAMSAVSWFGFRPQSLILPATAIVGAWLLRFRTEALFLIAAWGASFLSFTTKLFVQRPRPDGEMFRVVEANIRDSSFPSGHTLHYVAFWGFFSYLIFTKVRNGVVRWVTAGFIATMAALVGPSRVYLGHHWLTDVLASYLLGLAYLLGLVTVYRWVRSWLHADNGQDG